MNPYIFLLSEVKPINSAGWAVMVMSIGVVLVLAVYCFTKVLRLPPVDVEEHLRAPLDIDASDMEL